MADTFFHYTLDTTEEEARSLFSARYGVEPETVKRVDKPPFRGGKPWGWIQAGPVPEVNYDMP